MKLPTQNELPTTRDLVDVFGGYNHNLRIGNGEFYDMKNLTSSYYPLLAPRSMRGTYRQGYYMEEESTYYPLNPQGLIAKDNLCYVADGTLYINGQPITDTKMLLGVKCEGCPNKGSCTKNLADNYYTDVLCEKTLISMGAYIIIMPDKKYINTANFNDCGSIEATVTTQTDVTFELCKLDGEKYTDDIENIKSKTEPTDPSNMQLWLDISGETHVLKMYSTATKQWSSVATTYIKISSYDNIGEPFEEEDAVTISGITEEGVTDLNNTMVIWKKGKNFIVVTGMLDKVVTQKGNQPITITRRMPHMDFIVESNNRLWGCRYGKAVNGEIVNEIYASKLGDFKNWYSFSSLSTDSYVVTVGTDGQFTGAITHMGYPIFFKENHMHKIYGYYPANYQVQTTDCRGVQKGCSKSLAIVNEVLFYKSQSAICAYDGSLPTEISSVFGDISYSWAVAGVIGNKYYISMFGDNAYHLFVYDTKRGLWHREDNTKAEAFCTCGGELYYIEGDSIKTILGSSLTDKDPVEWMAETGIMGVDDPDKKYISRIDVRLSLEVGTRVFFMVEYDSLGTWEHLFTMTGTTLRSFSIPIRPKRCDHLRLRIEGIGDAKIYSISKTIEQGSEV